MKRLFLLFLIVFLFFGFVGCTSGNDEEEGGKTDPSIVDPNGDPNTDGDPNTNVDPKPNEITYLTVTEAYQIALDAGDKGTSERYYVKGTVKSISNTLYGEMYITDGTTDLYVYGVYSSDGNLKYSELNEKPYSNDEVYLYGVLKTYNGKPELGASWLQKFVSHQEEINLDDYEEMTIEGARSADVDKKIIVEGVVAYITYASGMKPNGLYLVDNTGSIYIYGLEVAGRVEVGEKVKIAGTKTLYILDSEKNNAATFGYLGSIQLQDAIYVSSSGKTDGFNKEWISESSVKAMLETPLSENITTNIFKVTAIINKVPGSGFVNYYINDLDNKTGSYCYSLCNGGDYSYLDKYDGLICNVYLSALNCKATKSGTVYRFVPILVEEAQDFRMTKDEIVQFALEYYVKEQFLKEYNSDPELELITSVSNEFIPFENVEVEYECRDDLVDIATVEDKQILHLASGNKDVTITLRASYGGIIKEMDIDIFINTKEIGETLTVKEVIDSADGTTVTLRGIVMSGTVNQTGFYLNDGTGVIAIRTDSETLKTIGLGNEIVVTGTKTHIVKEGYKMVGQACVDNAKLEANLLGSHEYDTSTFITNLTFDDMMELISSDEDLTTNVYVVKCYLKKVESQHYTNFYLTNEDKTKDIYLYAGSGSQYSIYNEFLESGELTVAFMLVNWNSKTPYRGCIITATDGEKVILNNYNFR